MGVRAATRVERPPAREVAGPTPVHGRACKRLAIVRLQRASACSLIHRYGGECDRVGRVGAVVGESVGLVVKKSEAQIRVFPVPVDGARSRHGDFRRRDDVLEGLDEVVLSVREYQVTVDLILDSHCVTKDLGVGTVVLGRTGERDQPVRDSCRKLCRVAGSESSTNRLHAPVVVEHRVSGVRRPDEAF